jgi:hypothetical protein
MIRISAYSLAKALTASSITQIKSESTCQRLTTHELLAVLAKNDKQWKHFFCSAPPLDLVTSVIRYFLVDKGSKVRDYLRM